MGQYGICVRAYPVVCARGLVCCIRVCTIVREGNAIPCIKHEAIRNYEWYGPPLLPGVYTLADAE